jgi:hypothetical protein
MVRQKARHARAVLAKGAIGQRALGIDEGGLAAAAFVDVAVDEIDRGVVIAGLVHACPPLFSRPGS